MYVDQVHIKHASCYQEGERSEMLDHFRSLSMEASALESNNHSLETEVQDARIQLRVANDRITDLEHLLETKDTLVNSCERQVCVWCSSVVFLCTLFYF
jgi:chromosome segregation ATPase